MVTTCPSRGPCTSCVTVHFFFFICLFLAASGLSCGSWDLLLWANSSVVAALAFRCPAACGILVPWLGIKPTSSALESEFLNTEPPGSPLYHNLVTLVVSVCSLDKLPCWLVACVSAGPGPSGLRPQTSACAQYWDESPSQLLAPGRNHSV